MEKLTTITKDNYQMALPSEEFKTLFEKSGNDTMYLFLKANNYILLKTKPINIYKKKRTK